MQLEEIQNFDSRQLLDPKNLEGIEEFSQDAMFDEPKEAQEFFFVLHDLVNKYKDDFARNPEILQKYAKILVTMFWNGLQGIEDGLKKVYISKYLVFSLAVGIDPIPKIKRYLDLFEANYVPDVPLRSNLASFVIENEERIGSEMIELGTREKVASQIKNWMKDYISSLRDSQNVQGSFDKVSYLTNNPNVQKLNPAEKELLAKVIDIYRFLKNTSPTTTAVPKERARPITEQVAPKPIAPRPSPAVTQAPVPVPTAPIAPAKPLSAFDQKLAQVSAPPPHGESLEMLKHRLEEVKTPIAPAAPIKAPLPKSSSTAIKMTPAEIKREVGTAELPSYKAPILPVPPKPIAPAMKMPIPQAPMAAVKPPVGSQPIKFNSAATNSPGSFKTMDDLKKIEIGYLRKGSLQPQLMNIKSSIQTLARANNLLPFYVVQAFEQSPLFQSYLAHGSAIFGGSTANTDLSQEEFEAMADLRNELERM